MSPFRWFLVPAVVLCGTAVLLGDDPEAMRRDAHRAQLRQIAESFRITSPESDRVLPLSDEPILLYTDATRNTHESALWAWGETGRPAAIMAIEYYPDRPVGSHWLYEIVSVSADRITVGRESAPDWQAQRPGLALEELPQAGVPADAATRRYLQMKQLLRRFTAHEGAVIEGRIELRLMANALRRYSDPDAQVIDGAVFAFANGTNPEVFVLLEAHAREDGSSVWMYSLAQMTGGAVTVSIDGKEAWTCDAADPPASRDSYWNGWLATEFD